MRQEHIRLDLKRASSAPVEHTQSLLHFADRLLQLLGSGALHSESINTTGFRRAIEEFRQAVPRAAASGSLADLTAECLETCEQFHRRAHAYLADREFELLDVIDLLRKAVATVSRGSLGYEQQIEASTERLTLSVTIDDLAELKHTIQEEVESIRRTTRARHDMEAAAFRQLTERVEDLEAQLVDAQDLAATDPLTGIPNRRAFERVLRFRLNEAPAGRTFVLALLDLDDFKRITDTHGHLVGERVLLCVAQLLRNALRPDDFVARFGGEAFAVVMAGISLDRAKRRFSETRQSLKPSYQYEVEGKPVQVGFTYSCGMTHYTDGDRADEALQEAKRLGPDQIVTRRPSFLRGLLRTRRS